MLVRQNEVREIFVSVKILHNRNQSVIDVKAADFTENEPVIIISPVQRIFT